MNLEQQIGDAIKQAMKDKEQGKLRGLRAIKTAIQLAKTEKGASGELTSDQELKILQKLVKQRKESIEIYQEQNRADLLEKEQEEVQVIQAFMPKQIDDEELKKILSAIIQEQNASSMKDMGKVMGRASAQLAGKADNKRISTYVKQLLSS